MGTKRVDEPLITINAMVKVGPWTIGPVYYGQWTRCERCKTPHKEVWTCTIDDSVDDATVAEKLLGRRKWLVGSTCGPTLEVVSNGKWSGPPKDLQKVVRLAIDASRAIKGGRTSKHEWHYLDLVEEWLPQLLAGTLDRHLQRVMRRHVNGVLNTLKEEAWKAAQQKTPPWRPARPDIPR